MKGVDNETKTCQSNCMSHLRSKKCGVTGVDTAKEVIDGAASTKLTIPLYMVRALTLGEISAMKQVGGRDRNAGSKNECLAVGEGGWIVDA